MDEHLCTLPLEYSGWTLGFRSHFVDMKFTDECGQVEMERVYFEFLDILSSPGSYMYKHTQTQNACTLWFELAE